MISSLATISALTKIVRSLLEAALIIALDQNPPEFTLKKTLGNPR